MDQNNKRVAKNTLFLYFRMLILMCISIYTSRVILDILGISNYGLYQAVGGIVTLLGFLNAALSNGSSRFITYGLGKGNTEKLRTTFCTILNAHILLALFVTLLAETVGLWFVINKMNIPFYRINAVLFAFHLSIITCIVNITQVPYTATIIAHEKMGVYAYVSLMEASLKLGIVFLLPLFHFDRLESYAALLFMAQLCIALLYRFYSVHNFKECHYHFIFDKKIFKEVTSFSGWSLIGCGAHALIGQGVTILLQMFFGPKIVAGRAIAQQVNMAATQFVSNFKLAANPQIVKYYAADEIQKSKDMTMNVAKFSFFLMLVLALPIFVVADPLLHIWLKVVPPYALIFLKLIVIQSLFDVIDDAFYTGLYAKGRVKENAMISPVILALQFPIIYMGFKMGASPVLLSYSGIAVSFILSCVAKPIILHKLAGYEWKELFNVFIPCARVTFVSGIICIGLSLFFKNNFIEYGVLLILTILITIICVLYLGLDKQLRQHAYRVIKNKIYRR